jgi:hypothetical protein
MRNLTRYEQLPKIVPHAKCEGKISSAWWYASKKSIDIYVQLENGATLTVPISAAKLRDYVKFIDKLKCNS